MSDLQKKKKKKSVKMNEKTNSTSLEKELRPGESGRRYATWLVKIDKSSGRWGEDSRTYGQIRVKLL